ncbi:hypothetical protein [Sphingomonas sp. SRS2]|uniref:hypothetical protein n=1 Tax=Sphingomonas sp. SRS2 TaxID=133190 RepID=UPI000AA387A5|nr:hypothetical protein [Sphingomonas sp. SRS2]
MSDGLQTAIIIGVLIAAAPIGIWLYDAPELAPDDQDGWSDRERDELRVIEHHEAGRWE